MPKCQPAEIHPRDANLQYSVKKCIYHHIGPYIHSRGQSSLLNKGINKNEHHTINRTTPNNLAHDHTRQVMLEVR